MVLGFLLAATDELVRGDGERGDDLAAGEAAHLRVARQASREQDLVHRSDLLPGRPDAPVTTLRLRRDDWTNVVIDAHRPRTGRCTVDQPVGPRFARALRAYRSRMFEPTQPIHTARMVLRPYEPADFETLHAMFSREDVCRYLPWAPMDADQAQAKLEQRLHQRRIEADGDPLVLAAVDTATGRGVGDFMLRLTDLSSRQGEIGWSVHPDFQGRGLATEGAQELLRLGFDGLGLHRIEASCDSRNLPSVRVMERIGMRREAHLVESSFVKGEWVSDLVYAILVTEWRARRDGADTPSI